MYKISNQFIFPPNVKNNLTDSIASIVFEADEKQNFVRYVGYFTSHDDAELFINALDEYKLKPGECHCGSKKYGRHHRPQDHAGWKPE